MTVTQFENGYWYRAELKEFAEALGIPYSKKLRKDELEQAIKEFLTTGQIKSPTKRSLSKIGVSDVTKGLSLESPIINYVSNQETKNFIITEAQKIAPNLKEKSGVRYRLNRWREEQLTQGITLTYRDLVHQYVKLNQTPGPFPRIPHGRYINFVSDFFAFESRATHAQATKAWDQLKKLNIPKDYHSWAKFRSSK